MLNLAECLSGGGIAIPPPAFPVTLYSPQLEPQLVGMNALYLQDSKLEVKQVPVPAIGQGEALIKVLLSGICATDHEMVAGYKHFAGIIGHEFVGRVVAVHEEQGTHRDTSRLSMCFLV